jgi:hypothetical protein
LPEPTGFTGELRAKKSFYNLTKDPERRMREALEHKFGFMAVTGYVGEQIETAPPESGFQDVRIIKGYAFLTGPEEYCQKGGFDYTVVGCNRNLCPSMPSGFGGVSGGAPFGVSTLAATQRTRQVRRL